ncbi:hypothetical protein QX776_05460 [Alteromonadaceae bacterium BrNp21-10]|nr:hypothetical protein [Alteromonadaceae bacterium BrNp21-10]
MSLTVLGHQSDILINEQKVFEIGFYEVGVIGINMGTSQLGENQNIVL